MTNDNNNALDMLINKFIYIVEHKNEKLKFDKTFKATIWKINSNNTYSINYKGQLYDVPNSIGVTLSLGQSVWVKIPGGILRDMHICGVANK